MGVLPFFFFLSWVKPYPLSAEAKVSPRTKLCTLGECSRKHQAQVKCVLPAAITAEPCRNSRTKFIKPFNTRSKKGPWGTPSHPNSCRGCSNLYGLTVALLHTVSLTTLIEQSRDWGITGICLEAALAALWHWVGTVALPHAKLTS